MKTQKWPTESTQMQSDMPVVNNTKHRPKDHRKPKGFTNSGNEWEQAELFILRKMSWLT